jgi:hypothetical protein
MVWANFPEILNVVPEALTLERSLDIALKNNPEAAAT